jgi:hypothetical protein
VEQLRAGSLRGSGQAAGSSKRGTRYAWERMQRACVGAPLGVAAAAVATVVEELAQPTVSSKIAATTVMEMGTRLRAHGGSVRRIGST